MSYSINYKCIECTNSILQSTANTRFPQYNSLRCLKCPKCHKLYYQCNLCVSKLMTDNKQITNHFNYHTKRKFSNVCNNTSTCEESNLSMCLDFEVDTMSSISSFDLEDNTIAKKMITYQRMW